MRKKAARPLAGTEHLFAASVEERQALLDWTLGGRKKPPKRLLKEFSDLVEAGCGTPLVQLLAMTPEIDMRGALFAPPQGWSEYLSPAGDFLVTYTANSSSADCVADPALLGPRDVIVEDGTIAKPIPRVIGRSSASVGAPHYVQEVAIRLDHALGVFRSCGFRDPTTMRRPIPVILRDMSVWGLALGDSMELRSRLSHLGHVPAHELFHLVQNCYTLRKLAKPDPDGSEYARDVDFQTLGDFIMLLEGTAEWATDLVSDGGDAWYLHWLDFLKAPQSKGLRGNAYSTITPSVIFWKYLSEQLTALAEPTEGADIVRAVFEHVAALAARKGTWRFPDELDTGLVGALRWGRGVSAFTVGGSGSPARVPVLVAAPDLVTDLSSETIVGNWALANICNRLVNAQPTPDSRLLYVEQDATWSLPALDFSALDVGTISSVASDGWATHYFKHTVGTTAATRFKVNLDNTATIQVVLVDVDRGVIDIIRAQGKSLDRTISSEYGSGVRRRAVKEIYLAIGAHSTPVKGTVDVVASAAVPDLAIAPLNALPGTEYQANPLGFAWGFASPDVRPGLLLVSTKKSTAGDVVVTVHNKGAAASDPFDVRIDLQVTTASVPAKQGWGRLGWIAFYPVPAHSEAVGSIGYRLPTPLGSGYIYVRAEIESLSDSSQGNNVAVTRAAPLRLVDPNEVVRRRGPLWPRPKL